MSYPPTVPVMVSIAGSERASRLEPLQTIYCSFCGNSQHVVDLIIAGPTVSICDVCVDLSTSMLIEHRAKRRRGAA